MTKAKAAHLETARATGKGTPHHCGLVNLQARVQAKRISRIACNIIGAHLQQPLAGRIDQMQLLVVIKAEHRNVDGGDDLAKQSTRLFHSQPLFAQGL
ncbi:MAG: hypothetical protein CVV12_12975 [Gammaproteobacteria bacterium HGW-Gammaproteobacteria-2]|nr:MAG: hypothetical protein CVV12_12975 [Gammaproteobacteria bacterium HGW-Gammaproteobacteria-2]